MKQFFKAALASIFVSALVASQSIAQSQTGAYTLPNGQFGIAGFGTQQSIPSHALQEARRTGLFEDTLDIRSGWIDRVARVTGRLDILTSARDSKGDRISFACTATAITRDLILTNSHCIKAGKYRPISMVFLPNFRDTRRKGSVVPYPVQLRPVEHGKEDVLDYAILKLEEPVKGYKKPTFQMRDPGPGEPMVVIGHPEGQPLHLSRGRCQSDREVPIDGSDVVHGCATRKGSSGSLVFTTDGQVVGLHFYGGVMLGGRETNRAVRMAVLVSKSPVLRDVFAKPVAAPAPKPAGQTSPVCSQVSLPKGYWCLANGQGQIAIHPTTALQPGETENAVRKKDRASCVGGNAKSCTRLGYGYRLGDGVKKNGARGAALYQQGCDGGNLQGCSNLALLYLDGIGLKKDHDRAAALYKKACDGENWSGCNGLGILYFNGNALPKDQERAFKLFEQACRGNDRVACSNVGLSYKQGKGVAKDLKQAISFYALACSKGYEKACENRAKLEK